VSLSDPRQGLFSIAKIIFEIPDKSIRDGLAVETRLGRLPTIVCEAGTEFRLVRKPQDGGG
jgi:hypothetical protein